MQYDDECFEKETIKRAKAGDAESARDCLDGLVTAIYNRNISSPYFAYLAECLEQYLEGVPIDRALGVESKNIGGRPTKYNRDEIAAADILLRDHAELKPEASISKLEEFTADAGGKGIDRREVQRIREECDSRYNKLTESPLMDGLDRDSLLSHLTTEMRKKVGRVLPQQ